MGWKVGSVPYVNAAPLVWDLASRDIEVVYDVPSRLPALLEGRAVSAVLVSSIYALVNPGLRMVGGVGICSDGPVTSVKIFSRVPLHAVQSVALDASSMTSNRLALEVLRHHGASAVTQTLPPDLSSMLEICDACVLIGDIGMASHMPRIREYDLG
ncbi:MAG: MqnA/MqnD/SBP family protein, partial [Armatimonadota bacterium]